METGNKEGFIPFGYLGEGDGKGGKEEDGGGEGGGEGDDKGEEFCKVRWGDFFIYLLAWQLFF